MHKDIKREIYQQPAMKFNKKVWECVSILYDAPDSGYQAHDSQKVEDAVKSLLKYSKSIKYRNIFNMLYDIINTGHDFAFFILQ